MTGLVIFLMVVGIILGVLALLILFAAAMADTQERRNEAVVPGIIYLMACLAILCPAIAVGSGTIATPKYDVRTGEFPIISWGNSTDAQGNQYIDVVLAEGNNGAPKYFHLPRERLQGEVPTSPLGDLFSVQEVKGWGLYQKTFTIIEQ